MYYFSVEAKRVKKSSFRIPLVYKIQNNQLISLEDISDQKESSLIW